MFRWTDEMIAFMKDAAAAGSYQKELSAWKALLLFLLIFLLRQAL